jgi:outer membrane protein TolC
MRSSVARRPRRIVRVIGPVSALILAGVTTTAQAQAVPRQPPPPTSPAPTSQPPAPGTSAPVTAGQPAPTGAARIRPVTDAAPVEAAPVITFGADGVSLEEALRLTLRHDSTIQLSAASADRLAGFAQEQAGIFDTAITGGVEYSYRVQELTESRKEDERNKRRKLDDFIESAGPDVAATRSTVNLLQQILTLPPGSEQSQVDQLTVVSPNLGSQLKVLNALIAGNPSQAAQLRQIRTDFLNAAFSGFNDSLTQQEESLRIARLNRQDLGDAPDDEVFQNTRAKLQFSKLFRTGIQVAPFVDFTAEGSNFKGKERKAEFGGKGLNDLYTTRVGSDFLLPLLRGRGGEAIAAGERAATIEAQAGTLDVEHQRASSILRTAQAYWELRAAQESLAILERSAARQGDLLKATTSLVNGGELARVELARSQAGEARARSRVLDARQRLYEARVELASALGVASSGVDATLPTAAKDPFPVAPEAAALQPWVGATAAAGQRRDIEAAQRREEAAVILQRNAVTELRSRLDLSASLFYTALGEVGDVATEELDENQRPIYRRDGFGEALDRWVGPSFTLTLNYEKPLGNNAAKGRLASRDAERRTRAIETADLRRQVRLNVARTATALIETIGRLKQTQAASQYYDQTITAELSRFRAGEATLINTIQTEQQATETDLSSIAAQQAVANLLAQLRFESGTLVTNSTVSAPTLVSLPTAAGRSR